jgi:hypothetical protein
MGGGWANSVQRTVDDALHDFPMIRAALALRGWPYGGALIVFHASVLHMGFRVLS